MPQEAVAQVLRLIIEFDGTDYHGWQSQPHRRTLQDEIQSALARIDTADAGAPHPPSIHGCSRTDAGVSARNYLATFTPTRLLPPERWCRALNYHLPPAVHVKTVEPAPAGFHARFSARWKHYHYLIVRGRSPLRRTRAWELRGPVDVQRLRRAARQFLGTRDFREFCRVRDLSGTCTIRDVTVAVTGDEIEFRITGNRFLYKMVRRIVGAMTAYGAGRLTLTDIRAALAGSSHPLFRTAPARGLVLDRVEY